LQSLDGAGVGSADIPDLNVILDVAVASGD
jgi:hypothetical protein